MKYITFIDLINNVPTTCVSALRQITESLQKMYDNLSELMLQKMKWILGLFNNVPAACVNTLRQYINKVPTTYAKALR